MKKIVLLLTFVFASHFADAQSCQANFTYTESALTVAFADSSYGTTAPTDWSWNFGDGTTSILQNPSHSFLQSGNYIVCLTIYKPFTNCQSTFCDSVRVGNMGNCSTQYSYTLDSINPNKINFTDSSSADVVNWQWDFGDGITGNSQNPSHIYAASGNFYVCLTTTDSLGCSGTYCDSLHIGSNGNCSSNFSFSVDFINPKLIYFETTSLPTPLYTSWNFDDGTIDSAQNPSHIFENTGAYSVCLTIGDSAGCFDTYCQQVIVGVDGCSAYFDFVPDLTNLHTFNFTDLSNGNPTDWIWDFGDGDSSYVSNPVHTYTINGSYDVCLFIVDVTTFCNDMYCRTIEVNNCYASYTAVADTSNPYSIHFTDQSLGSPTGWLWDFEDGTTSTLQNPIHSYPIDGWHSVCLTITNSNTSCTNTYCDFIYAGSPSSCYEYWELAPDSADAKTIHFYDYSWGSPPSSWLWSFGDGDTSALQNPVHTFDTAGYYWVCCTISDTSGNCSFTDCYNLNVGNFSYCPTYFTYNIVAGNLVSFTDSSAGSPTSYLWDFGAWGTSTQKNPSNNFQNPGTYFVCLTVSDSNCTSTYCDSVTINAVGVEDYLLQNNFSIYPNPTNNTLFIKMNSPNSGAVTLSIFNPLGELVEQRIISSTTEMVDFSGHAAGLYSIKIQNSKSVIHQKVMVVK